LGKSLADEIGRANCVCACQHRQSRHFMKKPNVRGPSPSRKAHLVLREKLNRKFKPAPPLPAKSLEKARLFRRNPLAQDER
jgi:hypothetical protein